MPRRISQLLIGLVLYGVASALMIRAVLGVDPWTVLSQGLSIHTGLGIGVLTNIVGVLVLLLWIPLRQRPGVGTILNILIIGPSIELGLWLIPPMTELWAEILMFASGLVLLAVASGLYIGARMGPGPRDGLMTGLNRRLGVPIWVARTSVEVIVLATGWILGGNVGLGTVAFALLIGPLCNLTLPFFAIRAPVVTAESAEESIDASESRPPTTPLPLVPRPLPTEGATPERGRQVDLTPSGRICSPRGDQREGVDCAPVPRPPPARVPLALDRERMGHGRRVM